MHRIEEMRISGREIERAVLLCVAQGRYIKSVPALFPRRDIKNNRNRIAADGIQ
jgi:hypothetical protein